MVNQHAHAYIKIVRKIYSDFITQLLKTIAATCSATQIFIHIQMIYIISGPVSSLAFRTRSYLGLITSRLLLLFQTRLAPGRFGPMLGTCQVSALGSLVCAVAVSALHKVTNRDVANKRDLCKLELWTSTSTGIIVHYML